MTLVQTIACGPTGTGKSTYVFKTITQVRKGGGRGGVFVGFSDVPILMHADLSPPTKWLDTRRAALYRAARTPLRMTIAYV